MAPDERFVFDTNVLVSALAFPGSTPRRAFDLAAGRGAILASNETLLELHRTLCRPKLARYFSRAEQEIFLTTLAREAILVKVTERLMLRRDPREDRFRDLLTLDPFRGTPTVTPAALLEELGREP